MGVREFSSFYRWHVITLLFDSTSAVGSKGLKLTDLGLVGLCWRCKRQNESWPRKTTSARSLKGQRGGTR